MEQLDELLEQTSKTEEEINLMSPLTWAYIGDCVYELYIRTKLVDNTNMKPHKLHLETIKYVRAGSQAKFLKDIEENLTEKEKEIVRRGRNAQNHHLPKNASVQEYRYATAFESLIGYLFLTKQYNRIKEIINMKNNIT